MCAVGQVLGGSSGAVVLASNPAMAAGTDYCQSVSQTQAQWKRASSRSPPPSCLRLLSDCYEPPCCAVGGLVERPDLQLQPAPPRHDVGVAGRRPGVEKDHAAAGASLSQPYFLMPRSCICWC